jgi:hypothetical protein
MGMTQLETAMRYADSDALEARQITIGMRSQHANMVVVLDALIEAVNDADWADFSDVLDSLHQAEVRLQSVYAIQSAEGTKP